jgi:hypothetical protein
MNSFRLSDIAHGRSGDKGNHANVAILAYTPAGYVWLKDNLTAERVRNYFFSMAPSRVLRYEAPNVLGLNFVLYDILAGGASRSLRIDTHGKTLALALLQMPIDRPENYESMLRRSASLAPAANGAASSESAGGQVP